MPDLSGDETGVRALPQAAPGPVTAVIRVLGRPRGRVTMLALRGWPALPPLALLRPALAASPRFTDYASQVLGGDALLCLAACLTITPLLSVARCNIAALRQWYGLWVFTLGAAGLAIALAVTAGPVAARAAGNVTSWTGLAVVMLMLPMALTANRLAQRCLGREWKRWQRWLAWAVWGMVTAHLAVLHDLPYTAAIVAITVPLLLLRKPGFRRRVKDWRAGGYSDGGMWLAVDAAALLYAAALATMIGQEAVAVAHAATLAAVA